MSTIVDELLSHPVKPQMIIAANLLNGIIRAYPYSNVGSSLNVFLTLYYCMEKTDV